MKVLELFAGVGGFRVGLERANAGLYKTMWANQWEPATKAQDAFGVYQYRFSDSMNLNISIENIADEMFEQMDADIIVGGFPCQDYSVARSKKNEMGLEGKKGVLFWEIIRAVQKIQPQYLILENVDRLLKSPSKQRGRDFAVMLAAFDALNYSVEWRVINAAEYGGVQRRRRVFFFVYHNTTPFSHWIDKKYNKNNEELDGYIFHDGLFARQFKVLNQAKRDGKRARQICGELKGDVVDISKHFSGRFWNSGVMRHGKYVTIDTQPIQHLPRTLGSILQSDGQVAEKYYIVDKGKLEKFEFLRGPKKIMRTTSEGHEWLYSEGGMSPYDSADLPGRTMLTSEGTVNRSTHLVKTERGYRLLTPVECERLNGFPDDWTKFKLVDGESVEVRDRLRYFFMGNALVTDIIERIGVELEKLLTI